LCGAGTESTGWGSDCDVAGLIYIDLWWGCRVLIFSGCGDSKLRGFLTRVPPQDPLPCRHSRLAASSACAAVLRRAGYRLRRYREPRVAAGQRVRAAKNTISQKLDVLRSFLVGAPVCYKFLHVSFLMLVHFLKFNQSNVPRGTFCVKTLLYTKTYEPKSI
jgi:hypothetical protein